MKNHVVKYPGSIKKIGQTLDRFEGHRAYSILSKANLPEGTLFMLGFLENDEPVPSYQFMTILLPSGEAFTGVAIKKDGDRNDEDTAICIAAGRAVAVWNEYFRLQDKVLKESFKALMCKAGDPRLEQLFAKIREGYLLSYSTDIKELTGGRQGDRTYTIITT